MKKQLRRNRMKRLLSNTSLAITLALCLASPVALASQKAPKQMSAHSQAVKACNDTYKAAVKEARTKKGQERRDSLAAASKTRKECLKNAPK
jgi:hypothetical protein